jgi:hypothetical protein
MDMQQLAMNFDEKIIEETKTAKQPLYTYRVTGIVDSNAWFVFRHRVIPKKGRRKAEVVIDYCGNNIEGRFETKEEAISLRDRLESEAQQCNTKS